DFDNFNNTIGLDARNKTRQANVVRIRIGQDKNFRIVMFCEVMVQCLITVFIKVYWISVCRYWLHDDKCRNWQRKIRLFSSINNRTVVIFAYYFYSSYGKNLRQYPNRLFVEK